MNYLFRWGREKYSEGREVGTKGREAEARGKEVGVTGREAGVGNPLSTPTQITLRVWSAFAGHVTGRLKAICEQQNLWSDSGGKD